MNEKNALAVHLETVIFDEDDLFDQVRMIEKLDRLILAWGKELIHKKHLERIPESDDAWLKFLGTDMYWGDLEDQWDHYVVGCLIFFVSLRADIKRSFLLETDVVRGQQMGKWLMRLKNYLTPLSKDVITKFCMSYSLVMDIKPIKVRYNVIADPNRPKS